VYLYAAFLDKDSLKEMSILVQLSWFKKIHKNKHVIEGNSPAPVHQLDHVVEQLVDDRDRWPSSGHH
jgi:hypothetical protein